jgi:hypothetical protein
MIAVDTLLAQVASTAPFLFADGGSDEPTPSLPAGSTGPLVWGGHPRGWLALLREPPSTAADADASGDAALALCCASHHATVATFVPTDVDRQIRGGLWHERSDAETRARWAAFALAARHWDLGRISARVVGSGADCLSGHDGEWLAVLIGALGATGAGEEALAGEIEAAIEEELAREARIFQRLLASHGGELEALRAAAILAHNAGDVDQGLAGATASGAWRARWEQLSHGGSGRFGGAFVSACRIYQTTLASEGHRNYPLREARALRRHPDLLLPIAPFLDHWGAVVAGHQALRLDDRLAIVAQLLEGCRTIPGQQGYQRALAGLLEAWPGGADGLGKKLPPAARRQLERPEMRKSLAVSRPSFEAAMRKRLQLARAG